MQSFLDVRDGTHDSPKYVAEGVPFVTSKNISKGYLDFSDINYITQIDADKINQRSLVEDNDILLAMIGSIGNPVKVKKDREFAIKNMALIKAVPDSHINMDYVLLLLKYMQVKFKFDSSGGVQNFVSLTYLREFQVPLPPVEEQQRIVDRVGELMEQIDEYAKIERQLIFLKESFPGDLRSSILQAAMQGKLTEQLDTDSNVDELFSVIIKEREGLLEDGVIDKPQKTPEINEKEISFEIPDTWRWVRWGTLSNSIQYGYNAPAQPNGDALMVRISDIGHNEIVWENVPYCTIDEKMKKKYQLFENDLPFARTGGTVGKSVLAKNVPENTVFAGYLIRSNYNERLNPQYLKYFMESELYWKQLRNGTSKTAQPNCNGKTLSKMMIPLPPVEEQERIVKKLDDLLPLCNVFDAN